MCRLPIAMLVPDYGLYTLARKHRFLAAANFEFVAIGVFEKQGVVTRAVVLANFGTFNVFPACVVHEFRNPIHFFTRICPEGYPCGIGTMVLVLTETEKFQRPLTVASIKRMVIVAGTLVNEPKLRQNFCVELCRRFHVCHPQIDMIEATRFHFVILNRLGSKFNCWSSRTLGTQSPGARIAIPASMVQLFLQEPRQDRSQFFNRGLRPQLPIGD